MEQKTGVLIAFLLAVVIWQLNGVKREITEQTTLIYDSLSVLNNKLKAGDEKSTKALAEKLLNGIGLDLIP
ncbi:TPA: hypothetical protein JG872_000359 [Enterobacter hormaechei subsp. xiangfangensis]|uniref:hypothetical protein n=1 Tax=Enterobacter hormaechei TaxID=158836 RepID=UPI001C19CBB1|nr:hypothetical protein [Enterobacter hormaechei subsp. xiangfangensis]HAV1860665.1 hypothetical protein [Enterobacter hormaechei subsp. xiangfangensis]